jgi:hypothetical protein
MFLATVHPVEAYHKRNKPSGASVKHKPAFESWNHELDSAYTLTALDESPSHLTMTLYDPTGLQ